MGYLLQHLMIESAKRSPDRVAVVYGDEAVTYAELNEASNKVASILIKLGVLPGDRVGIYINKSIPSIVSIFGILKAGAVYVPLDAQAPKSRISYIVDNCRIEYLLTSTAKVLDVEEVTRSAYSLKAIIFTDAYNEVKNLSVETVTWNSVLAMPGDEVPAISTTFSDLAYIIYTSGSTGQPKGVMITHLNSLTFVNWAFEAIGATAEDRFSSHAPLHFDLSIYDVFVAMKAGASLVLVPEKLSIFPSRLSSWIADNKISIWYSVPSILTAMVLHGQLTKRDFTSLKKIIFAGEVFPVKYLRHLMKLIPHPDYYNLYGPTETNVITYYKVPQIPDDQTSPIPIGIRCENMGVFAIDKEGNLVKDPGDEGELLATGTCVAKGYWGDQEKTDKVFIRNPLQSDYFDQAYRTGDLVSIDEQGNYLYKGRIDHMIKSRGYRIEIGEIEAAIYSHPRVKEAAVIAVPDELITNRIIAWVVISSDSEPMTVSDMRQFCADVLPKYMIPEEFQLSENLPKTSTGKIDRPALQKKTTDVC